MGDASGISDYELLRLAHIRRNQECLERLGLGGDNTWSKILGGGEKPKKPPAPRPQKEKVVVDESQCRRSGRNVGAKPEYGSMQYDSFFERQEAYDSEEEGGWGGVDDALSLGDDVMLLSPVGKPRGPKTDADKEAQYAAIIADSKAWLAASRAALCSVGGENGTRALNTSDAWMQEATRRWGKRVADVQCDDWKV
jgi:hypothetical protein